MKQKNKPQSKNTEREVLRISKIHSPSRLRYEDKTFKKKYEKRFRELFQDRLKIPIKLFEKADLLDFGSGTGEKSVMYSKWGANVTGVDFNPISIKQHKKLMKEYGLSRNKIKLVNQSLLEFKNKSKRKFDFAVSIGVLPHTINPKKGFDNLVKDLKKGGFAVIGVLNSAGNFQMNLQRYALFKLSEKTRIPIEELAEELFEEYIDRAEKFGGRLRKSIISDNYCNPKVNSITSMDVLKWFKKNKIKFYSSWPPLNPNYLSDSMARESLDISKFSTLGFISKNETFWMTATNDDSEKIKDENSRIVKYDKLLKEFCSSIDDINKNNANNSISKLIKKNSTGLISELSKMKKQKNFEDTTILFLKEIQIFLKLINLDSPKIKTIQKNIKNFKILFTKNSGMATAFYVGYKT